MGSETEAEQSSTPRLQLFSNTHPHAFILSPQRSGMLTPPHYTSASVPFRWEEEPGKPRGFTANALSINELNPKCLELPPRLLFLDANMSKLPSPTTVLDGPFVGKSRFHSSSFRIIRRELYGSFRRDCTPERGQLSALILNKRSGLLGSWRWGWRGFRGKREAVGASYVFPSIDHKQVPENRQDSQEETSSNNVKITRIRRSGSFSTHTTSRFWATICEGLKQVVPWRSRKLKKDYLTSV